MLGVDFGFDRSLGVLWDMRSQEAISLVSYWFLRVTGNGHRPDRTESNVSNGMHEILQV